MILTTFFLEKRSREQEQKNNESTAELEMAKLLSPNRWDFKQKLEEIKKSHGILIKGVTHQEHIEQLKIYAQNIEVVNFIKQTPMSI
jgi:ribosomal protein L9